MSSNLCQQSQAHRLYSLYLHYDASHTAKHDDPECKAVLQHCLHLFEKDYVVGRVANHHGQLCSSYPSELAILEKARDHTTPALHPGNNQPDQGTTPSVPSSQDLSHTSNSDEHPSSKSTPDQHDQTGLFPAPATATSPRLPQPRFMTSTSSRLSSFLPSSRTSTKNHDTHYATTTQLPSPPNGHNSHTDSLDQSMMDESDHSFDLGESGMMSFQDIKTELDMIHPNSNHSSNTAAVNTDRSMRHMLPFPFRIPRPEKKVNVAIKEFVPSPSAGLSTSTSAPSAPSLASGSGFSPRSTEAVKKAQESRVSVLDKDKVNDTHELAKQFEKSHFARVRARFVVPCILVRGKNICRSATLSNEVEVFMHSVNQRINDLNQKRKMFLYGTGEKSPDKEDRESSLEKQRLEDIELLHQLGVTYIDDLMVENRKVKYGLKVTSSEKVDSFGRYSKFKLVATPYPGVEFFQKFKANKYSARKLCFDWSQNFADAELQLPPGHFDHLGIRWRDYKSWDLIELTQNYLRLYLTHIADDTQDQNATIPKKGLGTEGARSPKGLLIHCISGWDRTPLFISLLRISLWADGEAHQSLTAPEILYLTMGYDWFLFNHLLADRSQRGEDIFYFCFYFLKFIYGEEFSLKSISSLDRKSAQKEQEKEKEKEKEVPRRPGSIQLSSRSPLLRDIGRVRGGGGTFAGPSSSESAVLDAHAHVCDECRISKKLPMEGASLGRNRAPSLRNSSQDAASSTDGKPSSWQFISSFSTPPGRDRMGSPRVPFVPTLQPISRSTGSPLGVRRGSATATHAVAVGGFGEGHRSERREGCEVEHGDGLAESFVQPSVSTPPFALAEGRFRLSVPQFNARRSSSSSIPELLAATVTEKQNESGKRELPAVMRTVTGFDRVSTAGMSDKNRRGLDEDEGDPDEEELNEDRAPVPRKRASTFDGGLLLTSGPDMASDGGDVDGVDEEEDEEDEEDLTSGDDDLLEKGFAPAVPHLNGQGYAGHGSHASQQQPPQATSDAFGVDPSLLPPRQQGPLGHTTSGSSPHMCYFCHQIFIPGSASPMDRIQLEDGVFSGSRPSIPMRGPDRSNVSRREGLSSSQAGHRHDGVEVDPLFLPEDVDGARMLEQDSRVHESDREEGMFQLEIEDRVSYHPLAHHHPQAHPQQLGRYDEDGMDLFSLKELSSTAVGAPSLEGSAAREDAVLSTEDEDCLGGGDENDSFWDETSTVDYGYSPGSILSGIGLGFTKQSTEGVTERGLSREKGGSRGDPLQHCRIEEDEERDEDDEDEDDDEDDDDDDDEAAGLSSRQGGVHHENDHLFMPSLKGVFSSAERSTGFQYHSNPASLSRVNGNGSQDHQGYSGSGMDLQESYHSGHCSKNDFGSKGGQGSYHQGSRNGFRAEDNGNAIDGPCAEGCMPQNRTLSSVNLPGQATAGAAESLTGAGRTKTTPSMATTAGTEATTSASTTSPSAKVLSRRRKLKQLRRLFMDIRGEIGDGSRPPSRSPPLTSHKSMEGIRSAFSLAANAVSTSTGSGGSGSNSHANLLGGSSHGVLGSGAGVGAVGGGGSHGGIGSSGMTVTGMSTGMLHSPSTSMMGSITPMTATATAGGGAYHHAGHHHHHHNVLEGWSYT